MSAPDGGRTVYSRDEVLAALAAVRDLYPGGIPIDLLKRAPQSVAVPDSVPVHPDPSETAAAAEPSSDPAPEPDFISSLECSGDSRSQLMFIVANREGAFAGSEGALLSGALTKGMNLRTDEVFGVWVPESGVPRGDFDRVVAESEASIVLVFGAPLWTRITGEAPPSPLSTHARFPGKKVLVTLALDLVAGDGALKRTLWNDLKSVLAALYR